MTEPKYGTQPKRIVFEDTDKRHAELKIRLHYDELTGTEFFRGVITGYLEEDEDVLKFIDKLKEEKNTAKNKKKKISKMRKKTQETINKFGLDESEIENIFDILEKEHPEL